MTYEPGVTPSIEIMQKKAESSGKNLITKWDSADLYSHLEDKSIEKTNVK